MLLQDWQGFTHLDPKQSEIPQDPFGGRLCFIAQDARKLLSHRQVDEIRKIASDIAYQWDIGWPEVLNLVANGDFEDPRQQSPVEVFWSYLGAISDPLADELKDLTEVDYSATMALMLVNEAVRLEGEAAAVAAIDAREAVDDALESRRQARRREEHIEDLDRRHKNTAQAQRELKRKAARKRHKLHRELNAFAVQLAKEERCQGPQLSAYKIADKICARVERHGREIGFELSEHRSQKTIHEWLIRIDAVH